MGGVFFVVCLFLSHPLVSNARRRLVFTIFNFVKSSCVKNNVEQFVYGA